MAKLLLLSQLTLSDLTLHIPEVRPLSLGRPSSLHHYSILRPKIIFITATILRFGVLDKICFETPATVRELHFRWVPKFKDSLDTANIESWDHLQVQQTTTN